MWVDPVAVLCAMNRHGSCLRSVLFGCRVLCRYVGESVQVMGVSHAATGAAVWFLAAAAVPSTFGAVSGVDGPGLAVGALVAAGAALLPDVDHRHGTIARSLPPLSSIAARVTEKLSGGHRQGTHSLVGLALSVFLASLVAHVRRDVGGYGELNVGAGVAAVLLSAFAIRALELVKGRVLMWLTSLALAAVVVFFGADNWVWFPAAVAVGYAAHLLGDLVTTGGIPVLWPFVLKPPAWWRKVPLLSDVWKSNGAISIPLLGDAGSTREKILTSLVTAWMVWVAVYQWGGVNLLAWAA